MRDFSIGAPYFKLGFLDEEFKNPEILSITFIGKNIEKENATDNWYFQDMRSFVFHGPYGGTGNDLDLKANVKRDGEIYELPEEQLDSILSLRELIAQLSEVKALM